MLNLAPWYFRNLLGENKYLEKPDFYQVKLLDGKTIFESNTKLKNEYRPNWLSKSGLYKDADGTGASEFKNIAVYKGISEALERWAFYETISNHPDKFSFLENPTTTGMASYPHFVKKYARERAMAEAIERWAIHQFNKMNLPVTKISTGIDNLECYRINVPFKKYFVQILTYKKDEKFFYGFASSQDQNECFLKSLVELDRNLRMNQSLENKSLEDFNSEVDRTLYFFSTLEGKHHFNNLINGSPKLLKDLSRKIICDKELIGPWSQFTVVWRYLLEDSYFDTSKDHTFFMF